MHGHSERRADNAKRLGIVLATTGAYLLAEVVGGLVTGSLALLADAGHMLTDVAGLALALVAIKFAARPATPEKTYGFYRVEILAALANAVLLIGISLYILYEAYLRFRSPPKVESATMLIVAAVGMAVNLLGMWVLRSGSKDSLNMKGAYFEVLSDLLTSLGVIVAAIIMWTTGWYLADPILSAGIGLFIFPRTWLLLKEAVGILLEGTPSDINLAALREAMTSLEGVAGVHDLHVWSLTSAVNAMSAHVVVRDGMAYDEVLQRLQEHITSTFNIGHVTLQMEARDCKGHDLHA
jgi:cobalt-zinc-cadmium efflux system protein